MGFGIYSTPRNSGQADYYRRRNWGLTDLASALNDYEWQEILEFSRQLFAQVPIFTQAVRQKNQYAFGDAWIPQYRGDNKAWGDAAENWIHDIWLPQCSYQGGFADWQSDLYVSGVAWDVDGDDLALFVLDEDNFPKIAYRSANQIGSGTSEQKIDDPSSQFDGARVCNGIIHDEGGRFLGVRLLRSKYQKPLNSNEKPWDDIPANQCDLQAEPMWRAQHRGMPPLACAILDGLDLQDIKTFIKRTVKLESSIGLMHMNEAGAADPMSDALEERIDTDAMPTAVNTDVKIENRLGGEIMYMRAGLNERLEALKLDRPGSNSMDFMASLERSGLSALGWFRELVDPSDIGGASVRLIQDQARTSVSCRQKTARRRANRALFFALGTAMRTGRIPQNRNTHDWMNWEFGLPACLTVDAGYDEQADRENLIVGTTTLDAVSQKKGRWWQNNRKQRLIENNDLTDRALEWQQYTNSRISDPKDKVSFRDALQLMQGASNTQAIALRPEMQKAGNQQEKQTSEK